MIDYNKKAIGLSVDCKLLHGVLQQDYALQKASM
jgi:hypothetical protein